MKIFHSLFGVLLITGSASCQNKQLADADLYGMSHAKMQQAFEPLRQAYDSGQIGAAVGLIAREDKIVFLESVGMLGENRPMTTNAIHRLASIGKIATAAVIVQLYERKLLNLNDPVSMYLPEYRNVMIGVSNESGAGELVPPRNQITIFHLLTHQSGLASRGNDFWNVWDQAKNVREFSSMIAELPLEFDPGEIFRYGQMGSSYEVLAAVAEVVAKKRFDMIIQNEILDPLHMDDTYFYVPESKRDRLCAVYAIGEDGKLIKARKMGEEEPPSEYIAGGGGLRSTITDFYKLIQYFLNDGVYDGTRILGSSSVKLMTDNQVEGGAWNADTGWGLGTAVQLNDDPKGSIESFGWNGGTGTSYMANIKQQWVAIIFIPSQPRTPNVRELRNQFIQSAFEAIDIMKD